MTLKKQANIETATRVALLYLSSLRQSSSGCFRVRLSAVETSSVSGRQMAQHQWKALIEWLDLKEGFLQYIYVYFL
jgi:hypothetical protein